MPVDRHSTCLNARKPRWSAQHASPTRRAIAQGPSRCQNGCLRVGRDCAALVLNSTSNILCRLPTMHCRRLCTRQYNTAPDGDANTAALPYPSAAAFLNSIAYSVQWVYNRSIDQLIKMVMPLPSCWHRERVVSSRCPPNHPHGERRPSSLTAFVRSYSHDKGPKWAGQSPFQYVEHRGGRERGESGNAVKQTRF